MTDNTIRLLAHSFVTIPHFIFKSPKLEYVDISDNPAICGPFPIQFIKTLKNIQFLNLSGNSFQGAIPAEIGNLTQLQDLKLSRNQLNGSIPSEIGLLTNLRVLELHENPLQGPFPSFIGNLKMMQTLNLANVNLNSNIPDELGLCTNLTFLGLASTNLQGILPPSMPSLIQLTDFGISSNHLSGEIQPYFMSNWTQLVSLQLQDKFFTGTIPSEIGLLKNLNFLYMFKNKLSGPIPSNYQVSFLVKSIKPHLQTRQSSTNSSFTSDSSLQQNQTQNNSFVSS